MVASATPSLRRAKGVSDLIDWRILIERIVREAREGNRIPGLADADNRAISPTEIGTPSARERQPATSNSISPGRGRDARLLQPPSHRIVFERTDIPRCAHWIRAGVGIISG